MDSDTWGYDEDLGKGGIATTNHDYTTNKGDYILRFRGRGLFPKLLK